MSTPSVFGDSIISCSPPPHPHPLQTFKFLYPSVDINRARYLVTDNSALNFLCAKILQEKYAFTKIISRRCLPHCLALVMGALFKPFEVEYGLASHLCAVRAFIKAGGGTSRSRHVLEYGLTLASIDFSDTRWEGFMVAVKYLMAEQSTFELERATEVLKLSAKEGDVSAIKALEITAANIAAGIIEKPMTHWNALYLALSDVTVQVADGELCVPQDALLNYNIQIRNWGAAHMLTTIGNSAPGTFRVIQGGSAWAPEMRHKKSEMLVTAVSAVNELLVNVSRLHNKATRTALVDETVAAARAHQEEILATLLRENEIHPDDEDAARARNEGALRDAKKSWTRTLRESSHAVRNCDGLDKLNEALDVLKVQQLYNINAKPAVLPAADQELIALLGVPPALRGFAAVGRIRAQWAGHTAALLATPPVPAPPAAERKRARGGLPASALAGGGALILSQSDVWGYWAAFAITAPELGMLALHHWLSPISSASVEPSRTLRPSTRLRVVR